jgi:uncharacterized integral membrane protein
MASEQPPRVPNESAGADTLSPRAADRSALGQRPPDHEQVPKTPPRTRTSAAFQGFVAGAVVLILLLIFILENTQSVKVSYFGASGHVPLGVALLLAAVGGALIVGILGAARIAQVRRHARRRARGPTT